MNNLNVVTDELSLEYQYTSTKALVEDIRILALEQYGFKESMLINTKQLERLSLEKETFFSEKEKGCVLGYKYNRYFSNNNKVIILTKDKKCGYFNIRGNYKYGQQEMFYVYMDENANLLDVYQALYIIKNLI